MDTPDTPRSEVEQRAGDGAGRGPASPRFAVWFGGLLAIVFVLCSGLAGLGALAYYRNRDRFESLFDGSPAGVATSHRPLKLPASKQPPVVIDGVVEMLSPRHIRTRSRYDPGGFPLSVVDWVELRDIPKAGKYEELLAILSGLQQDAEQDFHKEVWISDAISAFEVKDTSLRGPLDECVARFPDAALARAVRAAYFHQQGWKARGSKWARDTTDEQWQGMYDNFDRAREDAQAALDMNPRISYMYSIQIAMAMTNSDRYGQERAHLEAGLAHAPYSYALRARYIRALRPRWSGSYSKMRVFAEEAQEFAPVNPRLRILFGQIPYDQGSLIREDAAGAVALFSDALSYGESSQFYIQRAHSLRKLERWDEAAADFHRAVELNPLSVKARANRAQFRAYAGDDAGADEDMAVLDYMAPGAADTRRTHEYVENLRAHRQRRAQQKNPNLEKRVRESLYKMRAGPTDPQRQAGE